MVSGVWSHCHSIGWQVLSLSVAVSIGLSPLVWAADPSSPDPGPASTPSSPTSTPPSDDSASSPPRAGDDKGRMQQHLRKACGADVKQYCAQVKPGGGRIIECLEEHSKEVSDECYELLEKRSERRKGKTQ